MQCPNCGSFVHPVRSTATLYCPNCMANIAAAKDNDDLSRSNAQSNEKAVFSAFPIGKATTVRLTREGLEREMADLQRAMQILDADSWRDGEAAWQWVKLWLAWKNCESQLERLDDDEWLDEMFLRGHEPGSEAGR